MAGRGLVTLVGAGPGDPALLTLGAVAALGEADAVLYDALVSAAVLDYAAPGAELVSVGKRARAESMDQAEINAMLVAKAAEGQRVVRLKGGDPFVFGRGGEEALACRAAGVDFRVIPGVSSAVAVPAYAGIPVTHRGVGRSLAVITGSEAGEGESHDWRALAKVDTVVVLMGAAALETIADRLAEAGRDPGTPAASISSGTLAGQRSVRATLGTVAGAVRSAGLETPLITVIGEVAALADDLAWFEAGPLAGKSVVVTRTRAQASRLRRMLEALGATVIEAPVVEIRHRAGVLDIGEPGGRRWDWVVFTSQNGVAAFFEGLAAAGRDARALGGIRAAVIGEATAAELGRHGVRPDFVPSSASGESLAAELPGADGARILLPGGSLNDPALGEALRARGADVEPMNVYETLPGGIDAALAARVAGADAVTFASASAARSLRAALGEAALAPAAKLCAIGPQAAAATRESFGRVDGVAETAALEGLVAAVVEVLR